MKGRSKYSGTKHAEEVEPMQVIGFSQMFGSRKLTSRIVSKIEADLKVETQRAVDQVMREALR